MSEQLFCRGERDYFPSDEFEDEVHITVKKPHNRLTGEVVQTDPQGRQRSGWKRHAPKRAARGALKRASGAGGSRK